MFAPRLCKDRQQGTWFSNSCSDLLSTLGVTDVFRVKPPWCPRERQLQRLECRRPLPGGPGRSTLPWAVYRPETRSTPSSDLTGSYISDNLPSLFENLGLKDFPALHHSGFSLSSFGWEGKSYSCCFFDSSKNKTWIDHLRVSCLCGYFQKRNRSFSSKRNSFIYSCDHGGKHLI